MKKSTKGKLQVILGPMFSGKTSELIRRITRYTYAGYRCVIIHYADDYRPSENVVTTHDGREVPAILATKMSDVYSLVREYGVIGVDEGQFFPDLVEHCDRLCNEGIKVVVAGLDGTFQRTGFENMLCLIPQAESVVKLTAVCMSCSNEASFTKRIVPDTQVECLGGADKYMAVCQICYDLPAPVKRSPFKYNRNNKYIKLPFLKELSINVS